MLVNALIIFFITLISYQLLLANNVKEGLTQYQGYNANNPNNALILAQQNAGNIAYLKDQLGDIQGMNQQIIDLSGNVTSLQTQVNGIVSAQQSYASQIAGGTPPTISGTT